MARAVPHHSPAEQLSDRSGPSLQGTWQCSQSYRESTAGIGKLYCGTIFLAHFVKSINSISIRFCFRFYKQYFDNKFKTVYSSPLI